MCECLDLLKPLETWYPKGKLLFLRACTFWTALGFKDSCGTGRCFSCMSSFKHGSTLSKSSRNKAAYKPCPMMCQFLPEQANNKVRSMVCMWAWVGWFSAVSGCFTADQDSTDCISNYSFGIAWGGLLREAFMSRFMATVTDSMTCSDAQCYFDPWPVDAGAGYISGKRICWNLLHLELLHPSHGGRPILIILATEHI